MHVKYYLVYMCKNNKIEEGKKTGSAIEATACLL